MQGGTPHLHALKPERLRAPGSARSFESDVVLYLAEPVSSNRALKTSMEERGLVLNVLPEQMRVCSFLMKMASALKQSDYFFRGPLSLINLPSTTVF